MNFDSPLAVLACHGLYVQELITAHYKQRLLQLHRLLAKSFDPYGMASAREYLYVCREGTKLCTTSVVAVL